MVKKVIVEIEKEVKKRIPDLYFVTKVIEGVKISTTSRKLELEKIQILKKWRGKTIEDLEKLKNIKAYRNLIRNFGFIPNEVKLEVEKMFNRGILKERFPTINSVIDSINLVAVKKIIQIGVYDLDHLEGNIKCRMATSSDRFTPIGKHEKRKIKPNTPILEDEKRIFAKFGIQDSEQTKVTYSTKNLLLISWGTKEIDKKEINEALKMVTERL